MMMIDVDDFQLALQGRWPYVAPLLALHANAREKWSAQGRNYDPCYLNLPHRRLSMSDHLTL